MGTTSSDQVLRAIEALSADEIPLEAAVRTQGPGGEAYDRAPNPRRKAEQQLPGAGSTMTEAATAINDRLGAAVERVPPAVQKALTESVRSARERAIRFLKDNRKRLGIAAALALGFVAVHRLVARARSGSESRS